MNLNLFEPINRFELVCVWIRVWLPNHLAFTQQSWAMLSSNVAPNVQNVFRTRSERSERLNDPNVPNTDLPWPATAGHAWMAMAGHGCTIYGWPWPAMAGHGWSWPAMVDQWLAMAGHHGWPRPAIAGLAMAGHGRPML